MTLYRTKNGDRLDLVCYRFYGRMRGVVEAVLEANPRLAETHDVARLPDGLSIVLPPPPTRQIADRWFR